MKSKGFTLLEITVVIAIIILLSTIFLANYREGEKRFALQRSAYKLAQEIRRTQEMAMSSQKFEDSFPKGGYGVYLTKNSNSVIIFADCDGNGSYSLAGSAPTCAEATATNPYWKGEEIEEFYFEKGIYILNLLPSSPEDSLSITFFPPDPEITINPTADYASITLTFDGQSQKTITVNKTGAIDVD